MLTRRTFIEAGFAAAALSAAPAFAADSRLLADILDGVSDAVVRDYIRDHYQDDGSRWDGHYWWRDGKRYTPREYRDHLSHEYEQHGRGKKLGHYKNGKAYGEGPGKKGKKFDHADRRAPAPAPRREPRPDGRPSHRPQEPKKGKGHDKNH